ncbi:MAG: efflux RND transporter periplasmic adaptor subunit [Bacteroidetes bacterium]|nr:MAG: efflux RND transporter periplasmic adaptor subunit [Bacteroidota bacterium]
MMKALYYILPLAAMTIVSCQEEKGDLQKLQDERDSLSTLTNTIQQRILELDGEIAELDSTIKFTTVTLYQVEAQPFAHYFQVYGSVEADRNVTLFAETQGMIEEIHVREGQTVKEGQRLISIDDEVIRRNIEEAQTSLELADTLYQKQSKLWAQGIGSQVQYLEAKNRFESLQSRLNVLNAQLRMANLTAPFSGVVDEIFPKGGEYTGPGQPLIRLVNMNSVYVTADVPEDYINRVATGSEATMYFRSINDTVEAKVIQVGQYINPDNRTFKIKVGINDANGTYKPNMMASVQLKDYSTETAMVLPNHIIQQDPEGRSYVYSFENHEGTDEIGTVVKHYLELGHSYNGITEILSGLTGTERIIDRGARSVQADEHVRMIK